MQGLLKFSRLIDGLSDWLGKSLIWLILVSVVISAGNAIVRKVFNWSSNSLLEIQWYLFAAVFLLGGGYAFLKNVHVRIDFLSHKLSAKTRNLIDAFGIVVFLLPLCYLMVTLSWPLVENAYVSGEMSQNAGGLIRWPVYALIPLGFFLLGLQGIAELIKRIAFVTGAGPDPIGHEETASHDAVGHEIEAHAVHAKEEIR